MRLELRKLLLQASSFFIIVEAELAAYFLPYHCGLSRQDSFNALNCSKSLLHVTIAEDGGLDLPENCLLRPGGMARRGSKSYRLFWSGGQGVQKLLQHWCSKIRVVLFLLR